MEGQEHILRELFGLGLALQEVERQSEHHRLMLAHDRGEGGFAARPRLRQKLVLRTAGACGDGAAVGICI